MIPLCPLFAFLALLLLCFVAHGAILEMDADQLSRLLRSTREAEGADDLFVAFFRSGDHGAVFSLFETLEARGLEGVRLGLWDLSIHGFPSVLHMHAPFPKLVLWGAGGGAREPVSLDFSPDSEHGHHHHHHDHESDGDGHGAAGTCSEPSHNHGGDRIGAPVQENLLDAHGGPDGSAQGGNVTVTGVLDFLRKHATYPALVPTVALGDRWRGKNLFKALGDGLEAVRQQMAEMSAELLALRDENTRLRRKLSSCRRSGSTFNSACGGMSSSDGWCEDSKTKVS